MLSSIVCCLTQIYAGQNFVPVLCCMLPQLSPIYGWMFHHFNDLGRLEEPSSTVMFQYAVSLQIWQKLEIKLLPVWMAIMTASRQHLYMSFGSLFGAMNEQTQPT